MFDMSTAKPLEEKVGFDMSTAKPVEPIQPETSIGKNIISDVIDIGKNIEPSVLQGLATAGKMGLDVLTGSSVRDYLYPPKSENPTEIIRTTYNNLKERGFPAITEAITMPALSNAIKETGEQAQNEAPDYMPSKIGKTLYEHPLQNQVVNAAMLLAPGFLTKTGKTILKAAEEVKPTSTLETSKVLADRLGVQHSSIENLVDPELRKYMTPDLATKTEAIESEVHKSLQELPKGLSKAENKIYKNAGVDDKINTTWNKPLSSEKLTTPIEDMRGIIDKYKEQATIDEMPLASKAEEIIGKIIKDSNFDKQYNMNLEFGKTKVYANKLYELSQDDKLGISGQRLFGNMYQIAKSVKNSIPEIKKAGNAFHDIENVRELMRNTFRGFGVEGREFRAEKNIFSKYKEEGNVGYRENLNKVGEILNKYPETRELADFSRKVKLMNMAVDFSKAKLPATGALGKITRFIKPKPSTILSGAARLVDNGYLNTKALKGGTIPESIKTFTGKPINTFRAFRSALIKGAKQ